MLQIFTSYHAKAKQLKDSGFCVVNISVKFPPFADPKNYAASLKKLAPTYDMLKLSDKEYYRRFDEILSKTSPAEIFLELEKIAMQAGSEKVALLCYEKDRDTCHRSYVGDWIANGLGIIVEEVNFDPPKKEPIKQEPTKPQNPKKTNPPITQLNLF
jgi:hypothetical protein